MHLNLLNFNLGTYRKTFFFFNETARVDDVTHLSFRRRSGTPPLSLETSQHHTGNKEGQILASLIR
ncbi:hypothetical protein E2C01_100592 [Portunus trituberculatus]|uniref:Uncharacterized protein n=1 Tax=Portunus trituberculatus TaxID=210409 RepID=A0A5B7K7B4_PORTR|nr:hypothetical protein [Portunus trituberculatus]